MEEEKSLIAGASGRVDLPLLFALKKSEFGIRGVGFAAIELADMYISNLEMIKIRCYYC